MLMFNDFVFLINARSLTPFFYARFQHICEWITIYTFHFYKYLYSILTSNIYVHRLIARVEPIGTPFTCIVIRILAECCSVVCPFRSAPVFSNLIISFNQANCRCWVPVCETRNTYRFVFFHSPHRLRIRTAVLVQCRFIQILDKLYLIGHVSRQNTNTGIFFQNKLFKIWYSIWFHSKYSTVSLNFFI